MSPRKADPAVRERLLSCARDLFLQKGYAATGTDEICRMAGVSKGALFHNWAGKEELAMDVLAEWGSAAFQVFSVAPFWKAPTAVERALGYVDFTIELSQQAPIGCLIGTMALEVSSTHPELRRRCSSMFEGWGGSFAKVLEEARHELPTPAAFDSESLARHFVAVFEGAQLLAKTNQSPAVVREHLLHFRLYLASLLGVTAGKELAAEANQGFGAVLAVFEKRRGVEPGKMFGSVALKVKGKVFAMCVKGALVLKLPRERVTQLIEAGSATAFDPGHGKPMKEWAAIAGAQATWPALAEEAYAFVNAASR